MRRLGLGLVLIALAAVETVAHAQSAPPPAAPTSGSATGTTTTTPTTSSGFSSPEKEAYPFALINRPLILPRMMIQPALEFGITNLSANTGGAALTLSLSADIGIMSKLQAGILAVFPLYPNGSFGTLMFNGQYGLYDFLNLRVDIGLERTQFVGGILPGNTPDSFGFVLGVGAPIKWKLHPMLALVSGGSSARDFSAHLHTNILNGNASFYGGIFALPNDILSVDLGGDYQSFAFMLPVGVLFQPHERIGVAFRTGFRWAYQAATNVKSADSEFIPIELDATVTILKWLDAGFTFLLPGFVTQPGIGYGDIQVFTLWAQGRF